MTVTVNRLVSKIRLSTDHLIRLPRWLGALAWRLMFAGTRFANNFLDGYQMPLTNKICVILDHGGPASYNNTGTYATSGDVLNASDLGLGGFEMVIASQSSDGLNEVQVSFPLNSGDAVQSVALHWFVQATGAEVANTTNLSGKSIRLFIIGV